MLTTEKMAAMAKCPEEASSTSKSGYTIICVRMATRYPTTVLMVASMKLSYLVCTPSPPWCRLAASFLDVVSVCDSALSTSSK